MDSQRYSSNDWNEFQRSLFKQIPFMGQDHQGNSIENFVQSAIRNFAPNVVPFAQHLQPVSSKGLDHELFETHRSIFVRCRIPSHIPLKNIRFFANKRKLKIEHGDDSQEIVLPSDIHSARTIAKMNDGVLEIRMPKVSDSEPFREIFIRE